MLHKAWQQVHAVVRVTSRENLCTLCSMKKLNWCHLKAYWCFLGTIFTTQHPRSHIPEEWRGGSWWEVSWSGTVSINEHELLNQTDDMPQQEHLKLVLLRSAMWNHGLTDTPAALLTSSLRTRTISQENRGLLFHLIRQLTSKNVVWWNLEIPHTFIAK